MRTIHKYHLQPAESAQDPFWVEMPTGAKLLTAREQHNNICVWAEVDDEQEEITKKGFFLVGTGMELPDASKIQNYLGTASLMSGNLIIHVYTAIDI